MVVLTEKKGSVFTITINRPEVRNAVDGPTAAGLGEAFPGPSKPILRPRSVF